MAKLLIIKSGESHNYMAYEIILKKLIRMILLQDWDNGEMNYKNLNKSVS